MILLLGLTGDGPLDKVTHALSIRGVPFVLIDQRDTLGTEIELQIGAEVTGTLSTPDARIELGEVTSVYQRLYDWRQLPDIAREGPDSAAWSHALALESATHAWAELTNAFVINRASAMSSNNSKPYQASIIRQHGFKTPATLITTDPDAVKDFWERHGSIIYKSVSSIRSIVSRLTPDHLARLGQVSWCPTQFQQHVPGTDYRVHVVGEQVFASRIISDADDYRYAGRNGSNPEIAASELPDDVRERARALAWALELPVAGVDLRLAEDGDWYCFEVNPSPGFSYYESETGQPIANAIADLLAGQPASYSRTARAAGCS